LFDALLYEQDYTTNLLPPFLLYVLNIVLQVIHYIYILPSFEHETWHFFISIPLILLYINTLQQEYKQIRADGWPYLFSLLNLSQLFVVFMNLYLIIAAYIYEEKLADPEYDITLVVLPSIGAFLLLIQMFDWMTLIEQTSFFVNMLYAAFQDIFYFMLLLGLCILAFANAITVVEHNQLRRYEYNNDGSLVGAQYFIDKKEKTIWQNALFTEWLLGLGDFEIGEFNADTNGTYNVYNQDQYSLFVSRLLWFYFLAGTLVTQIILFNTLIAILGDTYSKITEKKQLFSVIQRTALYANYIWYIRPKPIVDFYYLYVIRPVPDEDDTAWEGAVSGLKNKIKRSEDNIAK
jgi:hypothetical protein